MIRILALEDGGGSCRRASKSAPRLLLDLLVAVGVGAVARFQVAIIELWPAVEVHDASRGPTTVRRSEVSVKDGSLAFVALILTHLNSVKRVS